LIPGILVAVQEHFQLDWELAHLAGFCSILSYFDWRAVNSFAQNTTILCSLLEVFVADMVCGTADDPSLEESRNRNQLVHVDIATDAA